MTENISGINGCRWVGMRFTQYRFFANMAEIRTIKPNIIFYCMSDFGSFCSGAQEVKITVRQHKKTTAHHGGFKFSVLLFLLV
jgi:hypothetical protein